MRPQPTPDRRNGVGKGHALLAVPLHRPLFLKACTTGPTLACLVVRNGACRATNCLQDFSILWRPSTSKVPTNGVRAGTSPFLILRRCRTGQTHVRVFAMATMGDDRLEPSRGEVGATEKFMFLSMPDHMGNGLKLTRSGRRCLLGSETKRKNPVESLQHSRGPGPLWFYSLPGLPNRSNLPRGIQLTAKYRTDKDRRESLPVFASRAYSSGSLPKHCILGTIKPGRQNGFLPDILPSAVIAMKQGRSWRRKQYQINDLGVSGEVTERPKVRHWKCRVGVKPHRGFESRPLR
jgi:hypothetical protein